MRQSVTNEKDLKTIQNIFKEYNNGSTTKFYWDIDKQTWLHFNGTPRLSAHEPNVNETTSPECTSPTNQMLMTQPWLFPHSTSQRDACTLRYLQCIDTLVALLTISRS